MAKKISEREISHNSQASVETPLLDRLNELEEELVLAAKTISEHEDSLRKHRETRLRIEGATIVLKELLQQQKNADLKSATEVQQGASGTNALQEEAGQEE